MAKSLLRLEARKLRKKGVSVKKIAKYLKVSKSSASRWVRDIVLTIDQLENLRKSSIQGAERGRLKNSLLQKEKWRKSMNEFKRLGIERIGKLADKEFLVAGLALYWGEGSKKGRRVQFCNSDPKMIKFLLRWLQKFFNINNLDIRCRIGINYMHMKREKIVKEYWSKITDIPLAQFTRTSFKKVENKKIYDNFNDHYGTLSVEIVRPSRFYGKIIGLIEGLHANMLG